MIGLVSINEDRNYGAVLQAVSLQSFLDEIGIDNKFVSFDFDYNGVLKLNFRTLKGNIKSVFTIIHYQQLKSSCDRFQTFIDANQRLFPKNKSIEELRDNPPNVDGYIVGSDQVWPETNLTPLYSLSFAGDKVKKISYAASMGKDCIADDKKETFREYLKNFDTISVREKSAIQALSEVFNGEVDYHVDPTLLHEKAYWSKYEKTYLGKLPPKFILVYMIYVPGDINNRLREIKKTTDLPIVLVSNTPYKHIRCDYYIRDAGPAEFLWLYHHAEGVISSSYHGVVFSTIYRKPFIAVINPNKRARLDNLLELLHLEERGNWDLSFLKNEYEEEIISDILAKERERSRNYLEDALL